MAEPTTMPRIGYLWISHLPLQVAVRRQPAMDGHAIIVGSQSSDQVVVDASDDCLEAGVRVGQPLREARELCPEAVILPANPLADRQAHDAALDLLETIVAPLEDDGLGRAYFTVDLVATGDPAQLLTSLRTLLLARLCLRGQLAIAPGKFAARIAAERDPRSVRGAPAIVAGDVAAYLAPFPVATLPLGPQALERLRLLGIATVGQFARVPRDGLTRRFGPEAALAHALAQGRDDRPLIPRQRPPVRTARHAFPTSVEQMDPLVAVAERLLTRLCQAMQAEGVTFRELRVGVERDDGGFVEKVASLRQAASAPAHCRTTLRTLVEAVATGSAVAALTVTVAVFAPVAGEQLTLFDEATTADERRQRLQQVTREVVRRYPARLRRVEARDVPTLLDEYHFALLPYEEERDHPAPHDTLPATTRRIEIVRHGGRVYLADAGRWDEIVAQHGSWRAEEWWPTAIARTYWRVRTRSKRVCTLSYDADGWRLVETFD